MPDQPIYLGHARRTRRFDHQGPLDRAHDARRDGSSSDHTLVIRDGRILDVLPTAAAARALRAARRSWSGPRTSCCRASSMHRTQHRARSVPAAGTRAIPGPMRALLCIAEHAASRHHLLLRRRLLSARGRAQLAAAQGLRAVIGLPVAQQRSPWAQNAAEYLTRALAAAR